MIKGNELRKPKERQEAAAKVEALMDAFTIEEGLIETLDTSIDFPALKEKALAFKKATFDTRPQASFDAGLYRSARYAVASGVFCHTAGYRGHFRALYEGARLMHPLKQ